MTYNSTGEAFVDALDEYLERRFAIAKYYPRTDSMEDQRLNEARRELIEKATAHSVESVNAVIRNAARQHSGGIPGTGIDRA